MFKKAIAGVLSAVLCATTLLNEAPFGSRNPAGKTDGGTAASQDAQPQIGVEGENSLARYLANEGKEHANGALPLLTEQPLKAAAADPTYSVTSLEFDRETGAVRVISSQTYAQKLTVEFTDEDDPSHVYRLETEVAAGEYIQTELTADPAQLPAYFRITARLTDRLGMTLCQEFAVETYTRAMQEILSKDINDFEGEQVVNYDDSETTNFAVLSAGTVMGVTTENSNTLVSADYDQNVYVFDQIDETIRTLEKGQFFYIQPNAHDIISICVKDIEIDGDTATLTADGEADIGEMFDFIKIEDYSQDVDFIESTDPELIEQAFESRQEYLAANTEHECFFDDMMAGYNDIVDMMAEEGTDVDTGLKPGKISGSADISLNPIKLADDKVTLKFGFKIPYDMEFNFYKDLTEVYVHFQFHCNFKPTFTAEISGDKDFGDDWEISPDNYNDYRPKWLKTDKPTEGTHLYYRQSPTSIPGVFLITYLDLSVELTGKFQVNWSKEYTMGYDYLSGVVLPILNVKPMKFDKVDIKGEFEVTLTFGVGVTFAELVDLTLNVSIGLNITADPYIMSKKNCMDGKPLSGSSIFMPGEKTTEDSIHACDGGLDLSISLDFEIKGVFGIGFKLPKKAEAKGFAKVFTLLNKLRLELPLTLIKTSYHIGDFHVMVNKSGTYSGVRFASQPCPNVAYKTTFNVKFSNIPPDTQAVLKVDKDSYQIPISDNSEMVFYAAPGSHTYSVLLNDKAFVTKTFQVEKATQKIEIPVGYTVDEKNEYHAVTCVPSASSGPEVPAVTTVTAPAVTFPVETAQAAAPHTQNTQWIQFGDDIWGTVSKNGVLSITGSGDMKNFTSSPVKNIKDVRVIVIADSDPEDGFVIHNIGDYAFAGAENAEVVYLPSSITSIGKYAFSHCANLKYLRYGDEDDNSTTFKLPEKLTTIGVHAFDCCKSAAFGALKAPETLTSIGAYAFANCLKLTSVKIPGTQDTLLGEHAFASCTGLKEVYFGEKVQLTPGAGCCHWFNASPAIEKLTIPAFNLGDKYGDAWQLHYMFNGPSDIPNVLTDVTVLSGTVIPNGYFSGLSQLKKITYPNNITEIGDEAFKECTNLSAAPLPETLTTIGDHAFYCCKSATFNDLVIPESVTSIGPYAFSACPNLTSVKIPGTKDTLLGEHAFADCANLKEAYFGENVKLRPGTSCCHWFNSSPAIEKLTLPAFNLGEKYGDAWQLQYLFNGPSDVPKVLTDVIILNGTVIPNEYFSGLSQLKNISYPENITEIGNEAFKGCANLSAAPLPETLTKIGTDAFRDCKTAAFNDLVIPESVTSIGPYAFADCLNLTSVMIPGTNETLLGEHAFQDCAGLKEAYIGGNVKLRPGAVCCHWFNGSSSLEKLTLPSFELGELYQDAWELQYLFNGPSYISKQLTDITVLSGKVIPNSFFAPVETLKSVTFSSELETVEQNAFKGCVVLEEAWLIGEDADWNKVDIVETGNKPLLDIVRKSRPFVIPLVILADPVNQTVQDGKTAVFQVFAASQNALSYQWQISSDGLTWADTDGQESILRLTASEDLNGKMYRCVVKDEKGNSAESAGAKLTVTAKPEDSGVGSGKPAGYKPGDANGDGNVDVSDAVLIARFAVGDVTANIMDIGVLNGDVNGDGNTDMNDVTFIILFIAKRISAFPVADM